MDIRERTGHLKMLFAVLGGLLLYVAPAVAQSSNRSTIFGTVRASDTGQPLPNVNVFLSRTNLGSATDREGKYRIDNIPDGDYVLVFSYVGFETEVIEVHLHEPDRYTYSVSLNPKSVQLKQLEVVGKRDREWERNLELFIKEFIGISDNAEKTELLNPEILEFQWNETGTVMSAIADGELHIINRALGYEIYLVLKKFEYVTKDPSRNLKEIAEYLIYPRYKKLNTSDELQKVRWKNNRKETYTGSFRHFLQSLYNDHLRVEGYRIRNGKIFRLVPEIEDSLLRDQPISNSFKKSVKGYRFKTYTDRKPLLVEYLNRQTSYLFTTENNTFFVNKYGKLVDVLSLVIGGAWHRDRLADELPVNYDYDPDPRD